MGFIESDKITVHVAKGGRLCLRYPFVNKNGDKDDMYIDIDKRIIRELLILWTEPFLMKGMTVKEIEVSGGIDDAKKE